MQLYQHLLLKMEIDLFCMGEQLQYKHTAQSSSSGTGQIKAIAYIVQKGLAFFVMPCYNILRAKIQRQFLRKKR